jgi:hypothetical protein
VATAFPILSASSVSTASRAGAWSTPPLTTDRIRFRNCQAHSSVERLIAAMAGEPETPRRVPVRLVVRGLARGLDRRATPARSSLTPTRNSKPSTMKIAFLACGAHAARRSRTAAPMR